MDWTYWRWWAGPDFRTVGGYLRRAGRHTEGWDPVTHSWVVTSGAMLDRVLALGDPTYEVISSDDAAKATGSWAKGVRA